MTRRSGRRRWLSVLLALVFVAELAAAAAVVQMPLHATHTGPERRAAPAPLLVRDRVVLLAGGGGPAGGRLLSRVASNIGAAIDRVEAFWGVDWTRDISVVAAGSDKSFAAAAGGPASQWADIAAVTVADRVDPAHRVAVGERILFAPGAAGMTEPALQIVLAHELFHYAARPDTALDAPRWLTEGVADFVARPITPVPPGAASAAVTLPSDADLDAPGPLRSLAYDRAWWFARFVADTYGWPRLRALYLAACGAAHADVRTAVNAVLGVDTVFLLAGWKRWMIR